MFVPQSLRVVTTFVAVVVALFCVGYISARAGNASKKRAVARVIFGGILAMVITYGVGVLFGTTIA